MKVFVAILGLIVAVQAVPARNDCELQSNLQELIAFINSDDIAGVIYEHMDQPDMQGMFAYMFTQEFRDLYLTVAAQDEIQRLGLWLEEQCVDVRPYLNRIRDYLEMPPVDWRSAPASKSRNGVADFWEDLLNVIPLAEIREHGQSLYAQGGAFTEFIDNLGSDEARALVQQLLQNETWQHMVSTVEAHGINVGAIQEIIQALLGWQ